jgi:ABC-type antimicrobial peptide transport system permease subunit
MSEKEELFTKDQNRLMSIAGWANNLAWVMLVVYLLLAALTIFLDQADYQRMHSITGGFASSSDYWRMARIDPFYYFLDIGSDILSRVLAGFMYYVVLKGISLGLYMVIETDMNYRGKEKQGGES